MSIVRSHIVIVMVLAMTMTACGAQMVTAPGGRSSSPYAPVNETALAGVVKYLNEGASSVIESRRQDAYRQMYEACNEKYRIDSEGPNAEGGAAMPMGSGYVYYQSQYWYIRFSCVK